MRLEIGLALSFLESGKLEGAPIGNESQPLLSECMTVEQYRGWTYYGVVTPEKVRQTGFIKTKVEASSPVMQQSCEHLDEENRPNSFRIASTSPNAS